jgi:uncharacterized protein (TIGR02001 family)
MGPDSCGAAAAPPAPDYTLTANAGIFSEYIFRGISQTAGKPAVQGGFDWAHSSGFYLGTWASNISWLEDFGAYTRSSMEWDFYGGYKGTINDDWNYDLGTIYYYYPGTQSRFRERQHLGTLRGAQLKWLGAKARTASKLLRRATHREDDGTWYFDSTPTIRSANRVTLLGHFGILNVHTTEAGAARLP